MKCAEHELITPDPIEKVKVKISETVSIEVDPMDNVAKAKRSAANPERFMLEAKGLKSHLRHMQRLAGDEPMKFGGHHESLMKKAADRACTEMFLVKPFQNIPGFQQRLLGEDQQWADRTRVEM